MENLFMKLEFILEDNHLTVIGESTWGKEINKYHNINMDKFLDILNYLNATDSNIGLNAYHTEQMIYEVENE